MNEFTREIYDYGICDFCGQPIDLYEEYLYIRRRGEYETRVTHRDCWGYYLKEENKNGSS